MSSESDHTAVEYASRSDVEAVLRVWAAARSPSATTVDDAYSIEVLLRHDDRAILIARRNYEIIGASIAGWDGWRGHIYRVGVLPADRLQGIGRALVFAAHARLASRGAQRVNVSVGELDEGAVAFWEALGYRRDAGITRFARSL